MGNYNFNYLLQAATLYNINERLDVNEPHLRYLSVTFDQNVSVPEYLSVKFFDGNRQIIPLNNVSTGAPTLDTGFSGKSVRYDFPVDHVLTGPPYDFRIEISVTNTSCIAPNNGLVSVQLFTKQLLTRRVGY